MPSQNETVALKVFLNAALIKIAVVFNRTSDIHERWLSTNPARWPVRLFLASVGGAVGDNCVLSLDATAVYLGIYAECWVLMVFKAVLWIPLYWIQMSWADRPSESAGWGKQVKTNLHPSLISPGMINWDSGIYRHFFRLVPFVNRCRGVHSFYYQIRIRLQIVHSR